MSVSSRLKRLERDLPVPLVLLLTAMVLALFTLLFSFWTAFSPLAFPQFVFCVVVLIYLPGKLLLDSGRVCVRLLEELTLSLVLGMTASSLVYRISTFFGLQRLFLLWSVTAQVVAVSRRRDSWRGIWPSSVLPARKRKCSVRAGCAACSIPRHSCPLLPDVQCIDRLDAFWSRAVFYLKLAQWAETPSMYNAH